MSRESIPRRAKTEKKAPTDYAVLVRPVFQPSHVIGQRKKEEAIEVTKPTPKRKLTKKQKTGKPTYAKMIAKAIIDLQERPGSSGAAIAKHVEANYAKYLPDNFKIFLRRALKNAVEDGLLKHEGARYRLSSKGKYKLGLKKKKKSSSSSSSSSSSKKRKSRSRSKSPSRARSSSRSRSRSPSKRSDKKKTNKKSKSSSKAKEAKTSRATRAERRTRSNSSSSSSSSTASKPKTTPAGFSFVWQYQEGSKWLPYEVNASDTVEKAYQDYLKNPGMCDVRAVKSGQWQYQVDFLNNKQTNIQHENHTVRSIRRVPY